MKSPVILITGASQGIGAAIAKVFAREVRGARLALVARNAGNLARVAEACGKLGAKAETFCCDVSDEAAVAAMAATVTKRFWRGGRAHQQRGEVCAGRAAHDERGGL